MSCVFKFLRCVDIVVLLLMHWVFTDTGVYAWIATFIEAACSAGLPVGGLLSKMVASPWDHRKVKYSVMVCAVVAGMINLVSVCCCSTARVLVRHCWQPSLLCSSSPLCPFDSDQMLTKCWARRTTHPPDCVAFTVSYWGVSNASLCCGTMLGVFMMAPLSGIEEASSFTLASAGSAMPLHAMVFLRALLGAMMTLATRCGLETLVPACGSWNAESNTELVTEPMDILERKLVTQGCALYTIKRTVTTGRVEVIVVHDSREQFNWTMQGIGFAFRLLNMSRGFVAMLSVSSHVLTKRLLSFLEVMALLFSVSITLLFVLRSGVATQMLMVNCMVYFCGYVFNAILDGVAGRAREEDSDNIVESWRIT